MELYTFTENGKDTWEWEGQKYCNPTDSLRNLDDNTIFICQESYNFFTA